jgi:hypothetical protein
MSSVFDVSPFDGGWCVKIADTGEVLFFAARRPAIAEARRLARLWPRPVEVKVNPRPAMSRESWPLETREDFAYPLGAPA